LVNVLPAIKIVSSIGRKSTDKGISAQLMNLPVANREHKTHEATYIEAAYFREWDSPVKWIFYDGTTTVYSNT